MKHTRRRKTALLLGALVLLPGILAAQLTTGMIVGRLTVPGSVIVLTDAGGFRVVIHPDPDGRFTAALPYGWYRLSAEGHQGGVPIFIAPMQTTSYDAARGTAAVVQTGGIWRNEAAVSPYPQALSVPALLLAQEPSSVTEPLEFAGVSMNPAAVESQRGFSWTFTQYKLQGMDATDSYQPGLRVVLPDVQAVQEVVVRSAFAQTASSSTGTEVGLFLKEPGTAWHGSISSANAGGALSADNLPEPSSRGFVRQSARLRWFTRDRFEAGGSLTKWADLYAAAGGQWASQAEPLASAGTNSQSRFLFGNLRGLVRAGSANRFDVLYSGSRIRLSDGGMPAGLEALTGSRMAPSFVLPGGFPGETETGRFEFAQVGWTHLWPSHSGFGLLEVRYGGSTAHIDTSTFASGQSGVEIFGSQVSGAPPLQTRAARPRHEIDAVWQPALLHLKATRHQIAAGVGWKTAEPRNRFAAPFDLNLITAGGVPAMVVEFNTPADSRGLVRSFSTYFADHVSVAPTLSLDVGVMADLSRGSLPAQSSPAGTFSLARRFAAQPHLIIWNSLFPRAGFAWRPPRMNRLLLRASYFRAQVPLAGRYLDFGNPNSLGGSAYQWTSTSFQAGEEGGLLFRFGAPYSSISPALHRPYSDEFDIGAEVVVTSKSRASIHFFRRDDKSRIAAINTGVPDTAFAPVSILDPGADGVAGTADDRQLTVYSQNPATLGQDRYLLTNPAGLRMLNKGFVAQIGTEWRRLALHASFMAEKSFGPTNPGDSVYENDAGVVGSLYLDPNTAIHAAGRSFVDRAYVGRIRGSYSLPAAWGGIEVATVASYLDGLAFARQLLVTDLPQGPFVVAATVRGSPEGGHRAEHVIDWGLRVSRPFELGTGKLVVLADIFNVTNAAQRIQESDLTGPSFLLRLPVAIQPPRLIRIGLRWER